MATVNQVILEGKLCKDAEFRRTKKGTSYSVFPLAVNRSHKDLNGNFQQEALFIDVEAWGEVFLKKLSEFGRKGQGVRLIGRLRQGKWEKDGKKYSKMYAVAETLDACVIGKQGIKNSYGNDFSNLAAHADGMRNEVGDFQDEGTPLDSPIENPAESDTVF